MDDQFLRYNALDSACMMEIHNSIWPELSKDFQKTYDMTIRLFEPLMAMQRRGMKVNHSLLMEVKNEIINERDLKQDKLNRMVGRPVNVNSNKDCCSLFYVEMGLPVITGKGTNRASVDDKALQRMVRGTQRNPSVPAAKLVQEIRGLEKLYSTYLNAVFDDDGRLRGTYNVRGTKFGRLSAGKTIAGTGLNYQTIPQDFKKFLVADDGYILMEPDKKQAEWVVVAYLANDANMIKAIKDGVDVHAYTASLMFNLPIEVIKYENGLIGHSTDTEEIADLRKKDEFIKKIWTEQWPRSMSLRQAGKKSNHGLNYGEGYNNFALINEISITEAKRMVSLYHSIYPNIDSYYAAVQKQIQENRTLTNCFGRKVRFMGDICKDMYKAAYSCLPQSTVVDSVNSGMCSIYEDEWITRDCNVDLLAQIHDSILLQIPVKVASDEDTMRELRTKIDEYMSPVLKYSGQEFKIKTDFSIGKNWGENNDRLNPQGMREYKKYEDVKKLLEI